MCTDKNNDKNKKNPSTSITAFLIAEELLSP